MSEIIGILLSLVLTVLPFLALVLPIALDRPGVGWSCWLISLVVPVFLAVGLVMGDHDGDIGLFMMIVWMATSATLAIFSMLAWFLRRWLDEKPVPVWMAIVLVTLFSVMPSTLVFGYFTFGWGR